MERRSRLFTIRSKAQKAVNESTFKKECVWNGLTLSINLVL